MMKCIKIVNVIFILFLIIISNANSQRAFIEEEIFQNDLNSLQNARCLYEFLNSLNSSHFRSYDSVTENQWNELWSDIETVNSTMSSKHYRIRYRYNLLIAKCASKGIDDVRKKAWIYVARTLFDDHILTNWNQVSEITCFIRSLTEINTSGSIGILTFLSHRENWEKRIQIVDLVNGGDDSWFNKEPMSQEKMTELKESVINDFVLTALDRLYYSNHSRAQEFRDDLRQAIENNNESLDPVIVRAWRMYQKFSPNLEGRSDLVNSGKTRNYPSIFAY